MPIKSLPQPCILVTAGLAVRKDEESGSSQMVLDVGLVELWWTPKSGPPDKLRFCPKSLTQGER
jgi:hypothetical protein